MQPSLKLNISLILSGLAWLTEGYGIVRLQRNIIGKTCTANRTFSLEDVPSVLTCAYRCDRDMTCTSFFYSSTESRCDGCSVNYMTSASLTENLQDSVYYRYRCPIDWAMNDYACYRFVPSVSWLNYDQAKSICELLSGHPVEIQTHEEQLYLMRYLEATYVSDYGYVHYWTGLNKRNSLNDEYLWETTGSPPSFTNWHHENPVATCIWMSHTHNYTWHDERCDQNWNLYPLCKM